MRSLQSFSSGALSGPLPANLEVVPEKLEIRFRHTGAVCIVRGPQGTPQWNEDTPSEHQVWQDN